MFHKVKEVVPLQDMRLCVRFANGSTKEYDVEKLVSRFPQFAALEEEHLFEEVQVDVVAMASFGTTISTFPAMSFGKTAST